MNKRGRYAGQKNKSKKERCENKQNHPEDKTDTVHPPDTQAQARQGECGRKEFTEQLAVGLGEGKMRFF